MTLTQTGRAMQTRRNSKERRDGRLPGRHPLRWAAAAAGVLFGVFAVANLAAGGENGTQALSYSWSMAERFGADADSDGLIDESTAAAYVNPASWSLTFDACGVTVPPGGSIRWRLTKGPETINATGCEVTRSLPSLGSWSVLLRVLDSGGTEVERLTDTITPVDQLVVSIGDSIASGDGNPDKVGLRQNGTFPFYGPTWNNSQCHRTALAGPAQAAIRLERRDPHSSVTFLHLACSGSTIQQGILGSYVGIEPDPAHPQPAQLSRAVQLAAGRPIDALLVSAGANDVRFADIVATCVAYANCQSFDLPGIDNAQEIYAASIGALPGRYDLLDNAIDPLVAAGTVEKVFVTEYFDPSKGASGAYCAGSSALEQRGERQPRRRRRRHQPVRVAVGQPNGRGRAQYRSARRRRRAPTTTARPRGRSSTASPRRSAPTATAPPTGGCARCSSRSRSSRTRAARSTPTPRATCSGTRIASRPWPHRRLGIGGTPVPFASDPTAVMAGDGLASFVGAIDQLDVFQQLAGAMPFNGGSAIQDGIDEALRRARGPCRRLSKQLSAETSQTITRIDNVLDDIDGDGDPTDDIHIPGLNIDLGGTIGPHAPRHPLRRPPHRWRSPSTRPTRRSRTSPTASPSPASISTAACCSTRRSTSCSSPPSPIPTCGSVSRPPASTWVRSASRSTPTSAPPTRSSRATPRR